MNGTTCAASNNNQKPSRSGSAIVLALLRTMLLDVPLTLLFIALLASLSANHIYGAYYVPLMEALKWPGEAEPSRAETENTYYARHCTAADITTTSASDLIVPPDESVHDAALRTQKHGMTIFPKVVSDDHAATLRDYILERNDALTETDMDYIWLISGEDRWSFKLGADAPGAADALRDIATHPKLRPVLEELMGEEPALVELTAITSSYGAGDQWFHQDNDHSTCQMGNARSFVSMYSLFIPLQDTSAEMGATDACAGTHYCASYDYGLCQSEDENIRVVGTRGNYTAYTDDPTGDAAYWKTGDAFLFDMPVIHRGPAHTDPTPGNERVMLILTFTPRPRDPQTHGFDRRQLGLGTSYSNRWDMWGMTLSDLEDAAAAMVWPWRLLRTLGIYKRPLASSSSPAGGGRKTAVWGFDMPSVTATRIINDQFGYREDDLETFVEMVKGHPSPWISNNAAQFMLGHSHEDFQDWVEETLQRSKQFLMIAFGTAAVAWGCLRVLLVLLCRSGPLTSVRSKIVQTLVVHSLILLVFGAGMLRLKMSPWGSDLHSNKGMASPFVDSDRLRPHDRSIGPTKLPVSRDVLLGNARLNSHWMASHNRMSDFHPGNAAWLEAMEDRFDTFDAFTDNHPVLADAAIALIVNVIWSYHHGDFLTQIDNGDWLVLSGKDARRETRRKLMEQKYPIIETISQEIANQISECRHGPRRDASLSRHYCTKELEELQRRLFQEDSTDLQSIIPMPRRPSFPPMQKKSVLSRFPRKGNENGHLRPTAYKTFAPGQSVVAFTEECYWRDGIITTGPDRHGRYSLRLTGAKDVRHGYTERRLRHLSETDKSLVEGTMAEVDDDEYVRLIRVSARFMCEFNDGEGEMDCEELIEE